MKTLLIIMFAIMAASITGCRSSKKTTLSEFGRPIQMPCEEKKFRSDADYIRASQVARSSDLTFSKEKAFLVTQERLVSLVESALRSAARRYANERAAMAEYDFAELNESMTIRSANSGSSMISIVCEETFLNDKGIYTTAMTLEIGKDRILETILNRQNRERFFRLDSDMQDFKKIFEEETQRHNRW